MHAQMHVHNIHTYTFYRWIEAATLVLKVYKKKVCIQTLVLKQFRLGYRHLFFYLPQAGMVLRMSCNIQYKSEQTVVMTILIKLLHKRNIRKSPEKKVEYAIHDVPFRWK